MYYALRRCSTGINILICRRRYTPYVSPRAVRAQRENARQRLMRPRVDAIRYRHLPARIACAMPFGVYTSALRTAARAAMSRCSCHRSVLTSPLPIFFLPVRTFLTPMNMLPPSSHATHV